MLVGFAPTHHRAADPGHFLTGRDCTFFPRPRARSTRRSTLLLGYHLSGRRILLAESNLAVGSDAGFTSNRGDN